MTQIRQVSAQRTVIDVVTDPGVEERLKHEALPKPWDGSQPLMITTGDNATIQIGEGNVSKNSEGDMYLDRSSGPTGAKALGPNAQAHSTGDVQQTVLSPERGEALADCFEQLRALVAEVKVPNPEPVEATMGALNEAAKEARSERPGASVIAAAWQKAKSWIESALGVGAWVTVKAEEVRGLVEKIQALLS